MSIAGLIQAIDNTIWAIPLVILVLGLGLLYSVRMKFGNLTKVGLQLRLMWSGKKSKEGISSFQAFCTIIGSRVGVGNIGGVMVAILYGGPGAVIWMIITALITSAVSYAENSLGQIYKVRMDGQYRGGAYYYMEKGIRWKKVGKVMAAVFAALISFGIPLLVTGPCANNIAMAFENSFGIDPVVTGVIFSILLFVIVAGGVRRIAGVSTVIIPVMTILYIAATLITLIANAGAIPSVIATMFRSAFNVDAVFGGLMGGAISYGVRRAVISSAAGFGETPAMAAASECSHPAVQGLVDTFSVYLDILICFCTGIMVLVTDCFNVLGSDGEYIHIGAGSVEMAAQAASDTAGVVWAQEAANTVLPMGGAVIAICLTLFAFSSCTTYYYESESALAYLLRNRNEKTRRNVIRVLKIAMPATFFLWCNVSASTAWAVSEIVLGLVAWTNGIAMIFLQPTVMKVYEDYFAQRRAGVKEPYFNPEKLGLSGCETWMEINRDRIEQDRQKS